VYLNPIPAKVDFLHSIIEPNVGYGKSRVGEKGDVG
jgi:hypothetical protein